MKPNYQELYFNKIKYNRALNKCKCVMFLFFDPRKKSILRAIENLGKRKLNG